MRKGGIKLAERKLSVLKGDQKEANSQITKDRNKSEYAVDGKL